MILFGLIASVLLLLVNLGVFLYWAAQPPGNRHAIRGMGVTLFAMLFLSLAAGSFAEQLLP